MATGTVSVGTATTTNTTPALTFNGSIVEIANTGATTLNVRILNNPERVGSGENFHNKEEADIIAADEVRTFVLPKSDVQDLWLWTDSSTTTYRISKVQ